YYIMRVTRVAHTLVVTFLLAAHYDYYYYFVRAEGHVYCFRFLIPCTHLMASQTQNVRDVDYYGHTAEKFLSLIPSCAIKTSSASSSNDNLNRSSELVLVQDFTDAGVE